MLKMYVRNHYLSFVRIIYAISNEMILKCRLYALLFPENKLKWLRTELPAILYKIWYSFSKSKDKGPIVIFFLLYITIWRMWLLFLEGSFCPVRLPSSSKRGKKDLCSLGLVLVIFPGEERRRRSCRNPPPPSPPSHRQ